MKKIGLITSLLSLTTILFSLFTFDDINNNIQNLNIKSNNQLLSNMLSTQPNPNDINHDCPYGTYCIQPNSGRLVYNRGVSGLKTEPWGATYQLKMYFPRLLFWSMVKFIKKGGNLDMWTVAMIEFKVNIFTPCFDGYYSAKQTYNQWHKSYNWVNEGNHYLGDKFFIELESKIKDMIKINLNNKKVNTMGPDMEAKAGYYSNGTREWFTGITLLIQF